MYAGKIEIHKCHVNHIQVDRRHTYKQLYAVSPTMEGVYRITGVFGKILKGSTRHKTM
jgi:hypothetical protein